MKRLAPNPPFGTATIRRVRAVLLATVTVAAMFLLFRSDDDRPGSPLLADATHPGAGRTDATIIDRDTFLRDTIEARLPPAAATLRTTDAAADDEPDPRIQALEERAIRAEIDALRHDDIQGNAQRAERQLTRIGERAHPGLFEALQSQDAQQRALATKILNETAAPATPRLVELSVAALRRGGEPRHAVHAACWLYERATAAIAELQRALSGDCDQQRFLAAFVLATHGHDEPAIRCILVTHLRDNSIPGDALMAAHALYSLGPDVIPTLRAELRNADPQAAALLELIALDLTDPPPDVATMSARTAHLHGITRIYADPVLQYRFHREVVPTW